MNTRLTPQEREQLYSLIREKLELSGEECPEEIENSTMVRELPGVDSMKLFRLLGAIELGFQVNLGFEAIPQVETVEDIERLICESREQYAARAS
ncbi:acyl carrier protein [Saccharothrix ecbatanensis]|uniref:Acyl carrier protein n=1 Tax=Saccharothrix ecbatanensis TaxID=1105145 RepID=A0A7W9M0R2_9PSEU|nr:acyl carrier protein [Saccharothrix ecbatanensis]MBB5803052.1 acyl carrier protein [Saccharothrix ecbatanensis]